MAENKDEYVIIRILESTRKRLKVKAARENMHMFQLVDELSKKMLEPKSQIPTLTYAK